MEPFYDYTPDYTPDQIKMIQLDAENYKVVHQASAASSRYRNLETSISVRDQFTREDYEFFRDSERVPTGNEINKILKACNNAYRKVGLVRNVFDLMGDFTAQGIRPIHSSESIQEIYEAWFEKVKGRERSERFANLLFRVANVVIKCNTAKLKESQVKKLRQAIASDLIYEGTKFTPEKYEIPISYTFISPTNVEVIGHDIAGFVGQRKYKVKIPTQIIKIINNPKPEEADLVKSIPNDILTSVRNGARHIILDNSKTWVYHYKKDDWQLWAEPLIYPILDDLLMLEKIKLCDISALDGCISKVRVWQLGNLEHKVPPSPELMQKFADILAHNVGGGTIDVVWGPDIAKIETDTDLYQYLDASKYEQTMTNIYQGIGVPPTLNGKSNKTGSNNNSIAVKTIVERLKYVRSMLTDFWNQQFKIFQQAMGFREPAQVGYDHVILEDEVTYRQFMRDMVDRGIISDDDMRDVLGMHNKITKKRINRENKRREKKILPPKASPYHNPQSEDDIKKMSIQLGLISPNDAGADLPGGDKKFKPVNPNGRPKGAKDTAKRKKKIKSSSVLIWTSSAQLSINDELTPYYLKMVGKKNVRSLSDKEFKDYERLKFGVLCNLEPLSEATLPKIKELIIAGQAEIPSDIDFAYKNLRKDYNELSVDEERQLQRIAIAEVYSADSG